MTLSSKLVDALLTFECAHCGLKFSKKGSWFKSAARFTCAGCQREARITYSDKIRIFARHAHLAHLAGFGELPTEVECLIREA
ncbi:hypothetical protein SAMN05444161_5650 [Rhizobiales bacterium GAS191]|jgi:peptide subunit release factor 1 (eRF1)|nr:hypothetical protein SAMN05519103_04845 [Rhizobiales bacterium GAS113]SEE17875.1 hypothetical protein SAMN05519104_5413 [Rhizobiales bacterium GAS188]SEE40181.1 hypothetical protein SAMN05444161_5650 [Rhizobiales bacterium GAS191]